MTYLFPENLPDPVLLSLGPFSIHWYGVFIVSGILAGLFLVMRLGRKYGLDKESILDLAFWLILWGLAGARFYHVLVEWTYYWQNPFQVLAVWNGGLAIHGAILGGFIGLAMFARRQKHSLLALADLIAPALALGQAIGRWGNYFNQELYGPPSNLPWSIYISPSRRLPGYEEFSRFHPAFLYEFLANLAIFLFLLHLHRKGKSGQGLVLFWYLMLYSVTRFLTEFLRIDPSSLIFGLRWAQFISLGAILGLLALYFFKKRRPEADS